MRKCENVYPIICRIARIWSALIIGMGSIIFVAEIIEAIASEHEPYPFYENLIPATLFMSVVGFV